MTSFSTHLCVQRAKWDSQKSQTETLEPWKEETYSSNFVVLSMILDNFKFQHVFWRNQRLFIVFLMDCASLECGVDGMRNYKKHDKDWSFFSHRADIMVFCKFCVCTSWKNDKSRVAYLKLGIDHSAMSSWRCFADPNFVKFQKAVQ